MSLARSITALVHAGSPAIMLALALSLAGCGNDAGPTPAASASAATALTPVPAPAGLLADVFVPSPQATWVKARRAVGGAAMFLPESFGGLVITVLGFPMGSAVEIDGEVPALGAVVKAGPGERPRAAIAIHVKVGDRLLDQLTKGDTARFSAHSDAATHITLLESKGVAGPVAMGLLGNYLIIGREARDVTTVGPYAARTLPGAPVPKEDIAIEVPEAALAGPITDGLRASWEALAPRDGRGPSSAIPPLIELDSLVKTALEVAGDLRHARAGITIDPEAVHARLLLDPKPGGGAASKAAQTMTTGDAKRLLDLPKDTLIALVFRDAMAGRLESAAPRADTVAAFLGKDVAPADREALGATMKALAEGRGDWVAAGFSFGPTGPAGYARAAIADEDKLGKAIQGLLDIQKMKGLKAHLEESKIAVSQGKTKVPGVDGDVLRVRLESKEGTKPPGDKAPDKKTDKKPKDKAPAAPPAPNAPPQSIDILVQQGKEELVVAAGYEARDALRAVLAGKETLASSDAVRAAVEGLGADLAFAVVIEPILLVAARAGKPGAGVSAPVAMGFGRQGDRITGQLDVPSVAIREFMRGRSPL